MQTAYLVRPNYKAALWNEYMYSTLTDGPPTQERERIDVIGHPTTFSIEKLGEGGLATDF